MVVYKQGASDRTAGVKLPADFGTVSWRTRPYRFPCWWKNRRRNVISSTHTRHWPTPAPASLPYNVWAAAAINNNLYSNTVNVPPRSLYYLLGIMFTAAVMYTLYYNQITMMSARFPSGVVFRYNKGEAFNVWQLLRHQDPMHLHTSLQYLRFFLYT